MSAGPRAKEPWGAAGVGCVWQKGNKATGEGAGATVGQVGHCIFSHPVGLG